MRHAKESGADLASLACPSMPAAQIFAALTEDAPACPAGMRWDPTAGQCAPDAPARSGTRATDNPRITLGMRVRCVVGHDFGEGVVTQVHDSGDATVEFPSLPRIPVQCGVGTLQPLAVDWDSELAAVAPGWRWIERIVSSRVKNRWWVRDASGCCEKLMDNDGEVVGCDCCLPAVEALVTRRNADEVRERAAADRPVRLRDFGAVDDTETLQAALDSVNAAAPYNVNGVVGVTRSDGLTSYYAEPPVRDWDAELRALAPGWQWRQGSESSPNHSTWWARDAVGSAGVWWRPDQGRFSGLGYSDAVARLVAERNGVVLAPPVEPAPAPEPEVRPTHIEAAARENVGRCTGYLTMSDSRGFFASQKKVPCAHTRWDEDATGRRCCECKDTLS
jgi:hypothetical protein